MSLTVEGQELQITPLAGATLSSVVATPLAFKLLRVTLPAGQATTYATGATGLVYQLSGAQTVTAGGQASPLQAGDGLALGAGTPVTFQAGGGAPAVFLHFLLLAAADLSRPVGASPASVAELYRTPAPLSGLQPGAYTFDMGLLVWPRQTTPNPPHYRSGAALYYVVEGTGAFTAQGRTEPKAAGSTILEPFGLVHQWANQGTGRLGAVVAELYPEGQDAVVFGTPPASIGLPRTGGATSGSMASLAVAVGAGGLLVTGLAIGRRRPYSCPFHPGVLSPCRPAPLCRSASLPWRPLAPGRKGNAGDRWLRSPARVD